MISKRKAREIIEREAGKYSYNLLGISYDMPGMKMSWERIPSIYAIYVRIGAFALSMPPNVFRDVVGSAFARMLGGRMRDYRPATHEWIAQAKQEYIAAEEAAKAAREAAAQDEEYRIIEEE